MNGRRRSVSPILLGMMVLAPACSDGTTEPQAPEYDPQIPSAWSEAVDNAFFPLVSGTAWEYEAETGEGRERTIVEVLSGTRTVAGIAATRVRDRVYVEGELVEDTEDWYAQDQEGNVWYLGEEAKEYEEGRVVSTDGTWEWGVDGALPGIIMWADPRAHLGEEYRQEFYEDEAEDWGRVVRVNESVVVPFGSFDGCVVTEDWSGLDEGSMEEKTYCQGLGVVLEAKHGGGERVELQSVVMP